jgi:hypothetical protein
MSTGKQLTAFQVPNEPLGQIDAFFRHQGLEEWTVKSTRGYKTIIGRTKDGGAVRHEVYAADGFRERISSSCDRLSPTKRRAEAKRMSKRGLTQMEIAQRLGCSQKTVSNDLRKWNVGHPRGAKGLYQLSEEQDMDDMDVYDPEQTKDALKYSAGQRPPIRSPRDLFRERVIYDDAIWHAAPILTFVSVGAFVVCSLIAILGAVLVYLGATGASQMNLFGQELSTTNVGVAAIFIGAVSLVILIRRVMGSLDVAINTKGRMHAERTRRR